MTNLERWRLLNKDNPSPANFIDIGFYYMVAAALERRVWQGDMDRMPLFFNMYAVLVGPPGVGKSWVMNVVKATLEKLLKPEQEWKGKAVNVQKAQACDITELLNQAQTEEVQPEYLIKFSADATSYEALVKALVESSTFFFPKGTSKPYVYAAMSALLDEFTSLFTKDSGAVKDFLLTMHGCSTYRKDTIKHGIQVIKNPWFSILAGTTPSRIAEVKEINILDDGFAARSLFIYANCNRFRPPFDVPPYSTEQLQYQAELVEHLQLLTKRHGSINFTKEALEWVDVDANIKRTNMHQVLAYYYTRRVVHIKKMAGLVQMSEDPDATMISLGATKQAVTLLNRWDMRMHEAFANNGLNELAPTATRIEEACATQMLTEGEILSAFYNDVNGPQLTIMLKDLLVQGRLTKTPNGKYTKKVK